MPKKYHVNIEQALPRFSPVSRYSSIEVGRCYGCRRCVKYTSCVYGVYRKKDFDPLAIQDTGDNACVNCFRCIQECKAGILSRAVNPAWEALGDDYWTPQLITSIWKQAETGKIPVSGAGYRGPFAGPGFDRMWTDMSEIVRPTRDGIHGREYVSTVIELGRKPFRLSIDDTGAMTQDPPRFIEVSIPAVLDIPPFGFTGESARRAFAAAAKNLGTMAVATAEEAAGPLSEFRDNLIVKLGDEEGPEELEGLSMAELEDGGSAIERFKKIKEAHPDLVVSVRVALDEKASDRALELAKAGLDVIHLQAGDHGQGLGAKESEFITNLVRAVHENLVDNRVREQVTLLASGGLAMAEHLAKIIICGADAGSVDTAAMVAMECRLCDRCREQIECPVELDAVPEEWATQRIVNLLGSWHSQLIEVMGAMGIREARRLRGEMGRAMFFEDLEAENFAPVFNNKKEKAAASGNPGWNEARRGDPQKRKQDAPHPSPPGHEPRSEEAANMVEACASRYRNKISKYRILITSACKNSFACARACRFGALTRQGGRVRIKAELCRGPAVCRELDSFCGDACPEGAVSVRINPMWRTLGDPRWTADLLAATWLQAETGMPPSDSGLEYKVGESGGGFDKIHFRFPEKPSGAGFRPEKVDLSIQLNKRKGSQRPETVIGIPFYGGGMSFGSISLVTMLSRARAYKAFNSFTCTGEGGYPQELEQYDDHVITQVATGLFGVREETIQRVRVVEFKYAQGAKPGLGGHLLGDKVTPAVAKMREAIEGSALFSPFPFHSVYSVEDHKKHVDWIKQINTKALVSVKVSTPTDVDMVAVGSYYAGAHIMHIDGSYGGTGAAPDIAKKNIAMPIEYAIPKVHKFLEEEGVRDEMTLIASGGIRTAWDIAKAIALGADGVVIGTSEMVALECIRCGNCESGRGCPRGIATTDPELCNMYDQAWGSQRLINLFNSYCLQLREILWRFGMKSITELRGRWDLLRHDDYGEKAAEAAQ